MGYMKSINVGRGAGHHTGMYRIDVKKMFFDRQAVIEAVGKAGAKVLATDGAMIRRRAQTSMRYRKKSADAGNPPSAHKTGPHGAALRECLYFSYDPATRSVVVGPEQFPPSNVPRILEVGGRERVRNNRRRIRQLGDGGEIRIGGRACRTTKLVHNAAGHDDEVTYCTLLSPAQVDRANRLQEELYGPLYHDAQIAPHPYMGPALQAEQYNLLAPFADSVSA